KDADEAYFLYKYRQGNIRFLLLERNIWEVALSKKKRKEDMSEEVRRFYKKETYSIYKEILLSSIVFRRNRIVSTIIEKGDKERVVKRVNYSELSSDPQITIKDICDSMEIEAFIPP